MTDAWVGKKVLVTGGRGFLGSHLVERLVAAGVNESDISIPERKSQDLRDPGNCLAATKDVDMVFHLAANVGGIGFNQAHPAELFRDNILMGVNLVDAAHRNGVDKFVMLGTVCAYPKFTPVPFKEEDLWTGYPEETNAPYGVAKKAIQVQLDAYRQQYGMAGIFLLPVNLYGPRDDFDLESSHVIPALIRKCVEAVDAGAQTMPVWGTGKVSREFLYVDDCARAIVMAAENYDDPDPVNLGTGSEITIRELAELIAEETGFGGTLEWQTDRPDGQPRRCLDTSRAAERFGFRAETSLRDGIRKTVEWYRANRA